MNGSLLNSVRSYRVTYLALCAISVLVTVGGFNVMLMVFDRQIHPLGRVVFGGLTLLFWFCSGFILSTWAIAEMSQKCLVLRQLWLTSHIEWNDVESIKLGINRDGRSYWIRLKSGRLFIVPGSKDAMKGIWPKRWKETEMGKFVNGCTDENGKIML